MLAGFVLARAAAGLSGSTISGDVPDLEQVRAWFGRPLREMTPADADMYFGKVMRSAAVSTRVKRAQALKTWFAFLELRHKAEIYQLTGHVAECPVDEVNRPRAAAVRGCGSRRRPARPGGCSRAGGRSSRRAGSSRRPPGTTRRRG